MSTLKDKLALYAFAKTNTLYLTWEGTEIGYAKGPKAPEEYPKEPLVLFYEDESFIEELTDAFTDLTDPPFSDEDKRSIIEELKSSATRNVNINKKEFWWHQLSTPLKTWLLQCADWRNDKPTAWWYGPRPQCCSPATNKVTNKHDDRDFPYIYLSQRFSYEKEEYHGPALWWCNGVVITYCPFCGTKLPEVVKDESPIGPIHKGNADYCETCEERNRSCICRPPSAAFKLAPTS